MTKQFNLASICQNAPSTRCRVPARRGLRNSNIRPFTSPVGESDSIPAMNVNRDTAKRQSYENQTDDDRPLRAGALVEWADPSLRLLSF